MVHSMPTAWDSELYRWETSQENIQQYQSKTGRNVSENEASEGTTEQA
jgi:hypothetical protein